MMKRSLGILTGGGDCPGLNAVIRAAVRRAALDGVPVMGIRRGWDGLRDADFMPLTRTSVAGILPRGGTILGTSRTNPLFDPDSLNQIRKNFAEAELGGLIVVGGNGTLAAAREMFHRHKMPVVGVPKT
ncbi:MAG TPA: 6-phosphofructokinase, partial [Abditibacterium sp.]